MAVGFDSTSGSSGTSVASLTWTHTNQGSGGNALVVAIGYYVGASSALQSTTVTYAGSSLSLASPRLHVPEAGLECRMDAWIRLAASTGASSITATCTSAVDIVTGAASYSSVSTWATAVGSTGNSTQASVTVTSAANDRVVDAVMWPVSNAVIVVGAGQTERRNAAHEGFSFLRVGLSDEPGAASVAMTWTRSAGAGLWGQLGINLVSAAVPPPPATASRLLTLGVQ